MNQRLLDGDGRDLVSAVLGSLLRAARSVGARTDNGRQARDMRLACCRCLGELGAVDPARLDLDVLGTQGDDAGEMSDERGLDMGNRALAGRLLARFLVRALRWVWTALPPRCRRR